MTAPFSDLIEESFHEATFLWGRWEQELSSPTRNLAEVVSWTEGRLLGALDGVRVGGSALVELAAPGLASEARFVVTVSAALLGSAADPTVLEPVMRVLAEAEGPRLDAILRGLEVAASAPALRTAAGVLTSRKGAIGAGALCRLKAFHRSPAGDELRVAFDSDDVGAQCQAVRAAGLTPTKAGAACITAGLHHNHPVLRREAVRAAVGAGMREGLDIARALAAQLDQRSAPYLPLLALLGGPADHDVIYAALRVEPLRIPALSALAHIGTVRALDTCVAAMAHEPLARAAGEAYCWVTGADLERDRLAEQDPPPDVPAFEDEDLDADLVPPPESLWPKPAVTKVLEHWQPRKAAMTPDVRYIHGQAADRDQRLRMVEHGPMLRRTDLVFELRARSRGRFDVETRAFAARQREMFTAALLALAARTS